MKSEIETPNLRIPSITIKGYRAFSNLNIPRLGHINLIVGRNNVGKSSLLEALWIFINRASPSVLAQILEQRDENRRFSNGLTMLFPPEHVRERMKEIEDGDPNQWKSAIESLFFGRPEIRANKQKRAYFSIETDNILSPIKLEVTYEYLEYFLKEKQQSLFDFDTIDTIEEDNALGLTVSFQGEKLFDQSIYGTRRTQSLFLNTSELGKYVHTGNLDPSILQQMWNEVSLRPGEEVVISALQLLSPQIERLSFLSGRRYGYPIVRLKNTNFPVPLKSLGEGMIRLLGIILSLINSQDGLLLIDEIDTGLHYSVQDDVWQLIFETARELNVQVFATTHSKETIDSFQRIANKHDSEGMLLSLRARQKDGMIVAVPYAEDELAIATENDIEVR